MRAAFLIKNGSADQAFEIRETPQPMPSTGEVLVKVDAFGLNFADVMARLGLYPAAPPIPAILGYDVVGRIESVGSGVNHLAVGQRVMALTRFGGYAEYAITDARAAVAIPDEMHPGEAVALATQAGTAYYMAEMATRLFEGDHVLIHAAAGGVGTALVQLAKARGCVLYGTAGSAEKLAMLTDMGVHHPINYREKDFATEIERITNGKGVDIIFDPVGGTSVKKGFKLLRPGGKIFCFGASAQTNTRNIFGRLRVLWRFGLYHPIQFLLKSRAMIGVNMLTIADERPEVLQRALEGAVQAHADGILKPIVGGDFSAEKIGEAHAFLESRQSRGKIVLRW
ncbi:MAG: zinc-binding dehydrogenase [Bacteroidota bacterium]